MKHRGINRKTYVKALASFKPLFIKEYSKLLTNESVEIHIEKLPKSPGLEKILTYFPKFQKEYVEIILSVATSPKHVQNPIWLFIIAPPSNGKSVILKYLNHFEVSIFIDDLTDNSLAPGKANEESAEVVALFDDANGKNLIINDMSSIFGQRNDKVNKFFGLLTSCYGGSFNKYSPGLGNQRYDTNFSIIMASTVASYKINRKYMNTIGNRFVFLKFRGINPNYRFESLDLTELKRRRLEICSFVISERKKILPEIDQELDDEIFQFSQDIVLLRSMLYAESLDDIEGATRLFFQLKLLIQSRARMYNKVPCKDDLEFYKCVAFETIGWTHLIKEIFLGAFKDKDIKNMNKMIEAGLSLKIIEENMEETDSGIIITYTFSKITRDFIAKYLKYKYPIGF